MTTTLQLDDELVQKAKAEAARQGASLDEFVEQALREKVVVVSPSVSTGTKLPTHDLGGPKPGVDLDNGKLLRDLLDLDGIARC